MFIFQNEKTVTLEDFSENKEKQREEYESDNSHPSQNAGALFWLLFSFCYSFVISVDGVAYHKQDFYSKYSMVEWERAPEKQRRVMLEDYIKRESTVLAALSFGFNLDPVVVSRLKNIKKQLLVNFF